MEQETYDVNNRYNSSSLSFWHKLYAILALAVVAFTYFCLPAIVDGFIVGYVWFNWLCWGLCYLSTGLFVASILTLLIYVYYWKPPGESKPNLSDLYPAAYPPAPPVRSALSYDYIGIGDSGEDYGVYNNFRYNENNVPAPFQAAREAGEGHYSYERVVAEYRKTKPEMKMEKARTRVEYRRMESERTTMSQTINGLSVEEVRMSSVATHISGNNYNGDFPQWQDGAVDQWQNVSVDQWQNCVPQWQNCVPQLQNGDVQRQRSSRDDGTGRRRHRSSRSKKVVGGSGSTGSGSYLAITN